MTIKTLTDELSTLYRNTLAEISDIRNSLHKLEQRRLEEAKLNHCQNMTHADFLSLEATINFHNETLRDKKNYAQGIFNAREVLLNHNQSGIL